MGKKRNNIQIIIGTVKTGPDRFSRYKPNLTEFIYLFSHLNLDSFGFNCLFIIIIRYNMSFSETNI